MKSTHRILAASLCAVALVGLGMDRPAWAEDDTKHAEELVDPSLAVCGHADELLAAREALAAGDRASAITHLKAAKALLVECERREVAAEPKTPARDVI